MRPLTAQRPGATRGRRVLQIILAALLGFACQRPVAPAAPTAPRAAGVSSPGAKSERHVFLWRANIGPSVFHFLGSVHVARPDLYPLDPRIEGAFAASDVLVLELVLDKSAQYGAAQRMIELGRLPDGSKLEDVVSRETYQLLANAAQRRGLSLFGLHGFRPWFVALTLTTQALESQGFSSEQGIDEHFRQSADGRLRLEALETVEQQLALFAGLSKEAEELMLRQTLDEIDTYGEELEQSFQLWNGGDAAALDQLLLAPMRSGYPALFAQLFTERNQRMLEKLTALAAKPGHYFVVVGAGHLVGKGGIVDLLAAQGIATEQL